VRTLRFVLVTLQLAAIGAVARVFHIEEALGFVKLLPVIFGGFVIHTWLPRNLKIHFFLLLGMGAACYILGPVGGAILVGIGLALVGICHLPIPFATRVALVLAAAAALALLRAGRIEAEWAPKVLPILGAIFMFRLIIYLYDLRNMKRAPSFGDFVTYFFLFPNYYFLLFPVVDFQTMRSSYYRRDIHLAAQRGIAWIVRGVIQLVIYRVIEEAIRPGFRERFPQATIATYDSAPVRPKDAPMTESMDAVTADVMENLRALGYIGEGAGPDSAVSGVEGAAPPPGTVVAHTNLAGVLLLDGKLEEAEAEILAGLKLKPSFVPLRRHLFTLREQQGRLDEAIEVAVRLIVDGDRISRIITDHGDLTADRYVLACGSYTPLLLKPLGIRLPVYPVKGYSITVPITNDAAAPQGTLTDETYKVVITRLGNRMRAAGTAELCGYDLTLRRARLDTLVHVVRDLFPSAGDLVDAEPWAGLRPMTPDNPPVIGVTPYQNLFLNTGHGTLGWTMACGSGRLLADLVSDRTAEIDLTGLTLARYV